jgi:hypothetical protein
MSYATTVVYLLGEFLPGWSPTGTVQTVRPSKNAVLQRWPEPRIKLLEHVGHLKRQKYSRWPAFSPNEGQGKNRWLINYTRTTGPKKSRKDQGGAVRIITPGLKRSTVAVM